MTIEACRQHRRLMALGAFALAWAVRCGGYEPGIEVQVALRPQIPVQSILTDHGYRVRLESIRLQVGSVRLIPCAGTLSKLKTMLTTTAYAHHVDVHPDQGEGTEALYLLHANGHPMPITTLRPPPGHYCYAEITLGPGRDSATSEGLTIHGQAEREGQSQDFEWHLPESLPLALQLRPRLQLTAQTLETQLIFDFEQSRLLDGHDFFNTAEPPDLSGRLRRALNPPNLEIL